MAELVQAGLEGMLTELEQIERVNLMNRTEINELVKRRQRFEYKLQKRRKRKEDIMAYINYECAVLQLIHIRREKLKYMHKKSEIDYAIAKRINKLFKIAEHRFGSSGDFKIWLTHLDFLNSQQWTEEASRIVRRLLQMYTHCPEVWIFAARFELDYDSRSHRKDKDWPEEDRAAQAFEAARRLLLEGLRVHPDAKEIFREHFIVELHYITTMSKFWDQGDDSKISDVQANVLKGKVAEIVLKNALKLAESDPEFEAELLSLVHHHPLAEVRASLIDILLQDAPTVGRWDCLSRMQLFNGMPSDGRSFTEKVQQCCQMYERGLERCPELLQAYTATVMELLEAAKEHPRAKLFLVKLWQQIAEKYPQKPTAA